MPLFALSHELVFPPVELAEPDGLLAMGGDLINGTPITGLSERNIPLVRRRNSVCGGARIPVLSFSPAN